MEKTSSKPKTPSDFVLSHFQDIKDVTAISTGYVKLGWLKIFGSLEWLAFQVRWILEVLLILNIFLGFRALFLATQVTQTRFPTL